MKYSLKGNTVQCNYNNGERLKILRGSFKTLSDKLISHGQTSFLVQGVIKRSGQWLPETTDESSLNAVMAVYE